MLGPGITLLPGNVAPEQGRDSIQLPLTRLPQAAVILMEAQPVRLDPELGWLRSGGWFSTAGNDDSILLRMKEDYDGAEPSATSVRCTCLHADAALH